METYEQYIYKMIFVRFLAAVGLEKAKAEHEYNCKAIDEAIDAEIAEMEKMASYYQYEFCK